MNQLQFVPADSPVHRVNRNVYGALVRAQNSGFQAEFSNASELVQRVLSDLRLEIEIPSEWSARLPESVADLSFTKLVAFYRDLLQLNGLPPDAMANHALNLAQRTHLVRAFADPDAIVAYVIGKVEAILDGFPKSADDIRCGRNPGDVLDPFILAATQTLLYSGDFEKAVAATVAHKALMMIEGLLGHLHEDVIGTMRGNIRAPEPRGTDQETLDLENNPFPGADVVQVPMGANDSISSHQLKSKTGSAKGGDGRRLGLQLKALRKNYGGKVFYHALIGNTLRGHRSKAGVEKAVPSVVVLVGQASFQQLTRTRIGADLLLRVYQAAFTNVQARTGYNVDTMTSGIVATFRARADQQSESFLELLLREATGGTRAEQDSRAFNRRPTQKTGP